MFKSLIIRSMQGYQAIRDLKKAALKPPFRGFPVINTKACGKCGERESCSELCPSNAITFQPLRIDLGKCVFCGDCEKKCGNKAIQFSSYHKTAADSMKKLVVDEDTSLTDFEKTAVVPRKELKRMFGRSLKLRQVSAGGCNGCELELNACGNVNFDMGRFGIEFVASPRHADGIVFTGPLTGNMAFALEETWNSVPDPKIIIAAGACAISGGVFADSPALNRKFLSERKIDLYVPGCPIHPLTFINGVLRLLGR